MSLRCPPLAAGAFLAAGALFLGSMTGCASGKPLTPTAAVAVAAPTSEPPLSEAAPKEKRAAAKLISAAERSILKNDWALARANIDEALAGDPKNVRALYYAGLCDEKLGKIRDAETHYRASLAEDATFPESAINLSALLIEEERAKEAVAVLLPSIKAWPSDLLLQENLGLAASAAKQHETAVKAFKRLEKALALRTETRVTYADSLLALGKKAEALSLLKAGIGGVMDTEADASQYALLFAGAGAPEEAKRLLDRVLAKTETANLLVQRGKVKLSLDDAKGAVVDFEAACKRDPKDASAVFALAEARDVLGQRAEAKKGFTAALRLGLEGELAEKAKKRVEQLPLAGASIDSPSVHGRGRESGAREPQRFPGGPIADGLDSDDAPRSFLRRSTWRKFRAPRRHGPLHALRL